QDRAVRAARWDREQDHGRHDYREQGSSTNPRFDYRPFAGDYGRRSGEGYGRGEPRGSSPATNAAATGAALASSAIHHDPHYQEWRQRQIDQLDRDYEDYRREHQSKFDDDFSGWRSQRQSRRQTLGQVREHMEVVGSDDQLIGKVDKVQGDKIILTKESMGGFHKSLGCAAIDRIEGDRVILSQSADETHRTLQEQRAFDERIPAERRGPAATDRHQEQTQGDGPHILERSFSGTYPDEPRR
ncbi:MAG: DUF2171 domain-containing protein, partial [Sphingomicrobium sp.]